MPEFIPTSCGIWEFQYSGDSTLELAPPLNSAPRGAENSAVVRLVCPVSDPEQTLADFIANSANDEVEELCQELNCFEQGEFY